MALATADSTDCLKIQATVHRIETTTVSTENNSVNSHGNSKHNQDTHTRR